MAVDFSAESQYKTLTFLAPWDFNWAGYESANGGFYAGTWQKLMDKWDRSNAWFITFMNADWFRAKVKAKVEELHATNTIEDAIKNLEDYLETLRHDLGDEEWKVNCGKDYCNYARTRLKYLKDNL